MEVNVKVDLKEAQSSLKALGINAPKIGKQILGQLGTKLKGVVRKSYKGFLKRQSGQLLTDLKRRMSKDGQTVSVYSKASENGTRYGFTLAAGFTITPKNGKWLTFKVGERWVKVASVTVAPRAWIREPGEAFIDGAEYQATIDKIIQKAVQKEFNKS